jgi:hypothetical protein
MESLATLGDELVRQHDHRHLGLFGDVEGRHGGVEAVLDIGRRQHHPRRVTVRAPQGLPQIRLLDLVGSPVDGPPRWTSMITAGISAMEASPSISVMSARPGPEVAVMALDAGERSADDRADGRQLVLGLDQIAAHLGHPAPTGGAGPPTTG